MASMARVMGPACVAAQREPFILPEHVLRQCGGSVPMRRQENESSASSYSSTLGLTYRTKGSERAPVWTIAIHEPQNTLVKIALLLALVSVKRVGELQALSINPACLELGPNDSKVVLKPRLGYVPKVLSTPFRAQVIALQPSTGSQELSLLCVVRALRVYIEHSASYRKSEQFFVGFGNRAKGPVTKKGISRWLVDAITLAHFSLGLQCPRGVRAHSTRGITSSWAWSSGVSISEIC